jgi:hypothetical protein
VRFNHNRTAPNRSGLTLTGGGPAAERRC